MFFLRKDIIGYQLKDAAIYWLAVPVAVMGSGRTIDLLFALPELPGHGVLSAAAVVLLTGGLALIRQAMSDLALHGRGTANPRRPPKTLVRSGVYSLCRHPMFLGYDLAALGIILFCRSCGMLLVGCPALIIFQTLFLRREERYLARRFQQDFPAYQLRVPFLIPRISSCWRKTK